MTDFTEDTTPRQRGPATIPRDSSPEATSRRQGLDSTWQNAIALKVHNTGSIPIQFSLTYNGDLMHYSLDPGATDTLTVDVAQSEASLDVTGA